MKFNQPKDYTDEDVDYTDTESNRKNTNYFGWVISAVIFGVIVFGLTKCSNELQQVIF